MAPRGHDLQLKEQLFLQQKWEDDVDVDEGNVCDFCVRSVKPNKFFDMTPVAARLVEFEPTLANLQTSAYTTGPVADSDMPLIRNHVQTES